jgi:hypothetical protein
MMAKFDASAVWRRFTDDTQPQLSLFMAVPTVYGAFCFMCCTREWGVLILLFYGSQADRGL